jgi:hypothetical protein
LLPAGGQRLLAVQRPQHLDAAAQVAVSATRVGVWSPRMEESITSAKLSLLDRLEQGR